MIDPILQNRIVSRIQAGVDEAEATFRSHAYSPSLSDGESGICLFSPDGSLWAEGSTSAPLQSALLQTWVREQEARLDRGAGILLSNDPYTGGGTVCDVKMIAPVAMGDVGTAWIAISGHYPDVGGRTLGGVAPGARSVHEEGVRIPVSPATESVFVLMSANCRFPGILQSDLVAQTTALETARTWMQRLGASHSWPTVHEASESVRVRSRAALDAARAELKEGVYVRRDRLDSDTDEERSVPLELSLEVSEEALILDFQGSGGLSDGPTNCTRASSLAACQCGLRQIFPEIPACGFSIDDLQIRVSHGSLLDASFPTPVGGTSDILADRVASLVVEALSQSVHGRGKACDGGGGNVIVIEQEGGGDPFVLRLVVGSGGGASGRGDGLTNTDSETRFSIFPSVESLERAFPVRVRCSEEREASGGAGRYRGGDGTVFEIESLLPKARLTVYADRFRRGAGGHHRGGRGEKTRVEVWCDGDWRSFPQRGRCQSQELSAHDRVRIQTAGGGGYGHPYERAIRLVSDDVVSERLSRKEAAKRHGVVFTSSSATDYDSAKTFKLRSYRLTSSDVDDFLDEIETLED